MDKNAYLKQWRQEYVEKKGNITLAQAAKNEDFKKKWAAYPNKKKKTTKKTPEPPRKEPSKTPAEAWNEKLRMLPSGFEHKIGEGLGGEVGYGESTDMTVLVETTTGLLFGLLLNGVVVLLVEIGEDGNARTYREFAVYFGKEMEDGAKWMNKELGPLTYWNNNANYLMEASQPKLKEILNRGYTIGGYKTGPPPKKIAEMFYRGKMPSLPNILYADVREDIGMYKSPPERPKYERPKSAYERFTDEGYGD